MKKTIKYMFYVGFIQSISLSLILAYIGSLLSIYFVIYFAVILEFYEDFLRFENRCDKKNNQMQEEYEKLYRDCPIHLRKHIFTKIHSFLT